MDVNKKYHGRLNLLANNNDRKSIEQRIEKLKKLDRQRRGYSDWWWEKRMLKLAIYELEIALGKRTNNPELVLIE